MSKTTKYVFLVVLPNNSLGKQTLIPKSYSTLHMDLVNIRRLLAAHVVKILLKNAIEVVFTWFHFCISLGAYSPVNIYPYVEKGNKFNWVMLGLGALRLFAR